MSLGRDSTVTTVQVDLSHTVGPLKPLHGLNNGPVGYGSLVDVGHRYREIAVPYVRLHDPNWPHPREVDIPQVFPDFRADPSNPSAYDFARTDDYLQRIADTGARIIYRLGVSIEHTETKVYTHPPADFDKWARICLGIVRHYNEGWADGYRDRVAYWEIWNEPDIGDKMWSGTVEHYFDLYARTAKLLKHHDPDLRVGGPATAKLAPPHPAAGFLKRFLDYCRTHRCPLDFISWHKYTDDPQDILTHALDVDSLMRTYGFGGAESHLNEWNYTPFRWNIFEQGKELARREGFERQKDHEGSSFVATSLALLQDAPVDIATYYDGQPSALFCGIFDYYGVPQRTFYAFKAFSELRSQTARLRSEITPENSGIRCLAAGDPETGTAKILISRFAPAGKEECSSVPQPEIVDIVLQGVSITTARYEVKVIDEGHAFDVVRSGGLNQAEPRVRVSLRDHAVALITLTPAEDGKTAPIAGPD